MLELQAAYALLEAKVSNLTTEVSTLKSAIDLLTRSQAQKNDTTDEHKGTISLANMSQPTQEAQEVTQETNGQENSWRSVQNRKPRRSHYTSHNHQLVEKQKNKFTK
ncbi:MAG: hypothetical protein NTX86_02190 [Candidatus Dependentiae bacterium]|nr:hypothetical protein [Candidatus Dependentiae bacterium]